MIFEATRGHHDFTAREAVRVPPCKELMTVHLVGVGYYVNAWNGA